MKRWEEKSRVRGKNELLLAPENPSCIRIGFDRYPHIRRMLDPFEKNH